MADPTTDFIMMDVIGSLVQIPIYAAIIGIPIWFARKWYIKNKKSKAIQG